MIRNTSLQLSYSLIAPLYDLVMEKFSSAMRQRSLSALSLLSPPQTVLISGIGSGLDLPFLAPGPDYYGLDLTANMLKRVQQRNSKLNCQLQIGNAMRLPYRSESFDVVILHLIVAVTPDPSATLMEACRVVKPGGHLLLMDKFLRPQQSAPLRRLISPLVGLFATQTNLVWENIVQQTRQRLQQRLPGTDFEIIKDEPDSVGGWFRRIVIQRIA